jgi:poly(A) polymerase
MDEALARVLEDADPIARRFVEHGFRVYLVGGIVRDVVLGRHHLAPDIDLTTDATPDQIVGLLEGFVDVVWKQGARFGTIGCRLGSRTFEITTHRSEAYVTDSRKPVVAFSHEVNDDLSRRDFTVNAMAISIPDAEFVDPFGGRADLAARVLRTPLAPEVSFSDDPLRMLRAARFAAGYNLAVEPQTEQAISALRHRMEIVSRERIRDEFDKLLAVTDPVAGLRLLHRSGLFHEFLPEVQLLEHADDTFVFVASLAGVRRRRSAIFFVMGDEPTRIARARALKYSNDDVDHIRAVGRGVARLGELAEVSDSTTRRFVHEFGGVLDDVLAIATGCGLARADDLRSSIQSLSAREDLATLRSPLDGDAVRAVLGLAAGPAVGEALAYLLDQRLDEGPFSADDARARLQRWWRAR